MTERACTSGDFAEWRFEDGGRGPVLECHRYPPVQQLADELLPAPTDSPELIEERSNVVESILEVSRYPKVRAEDWCGEYLDRYR